jgi:hypothetical protein
VTWSPDRAAHRVRGARDGDEAAQVYVLDLAAGGEARP